MPEGGNELLFLRDLADVEPPRDRYAYYEEEDIYRLVPRPQWTGLEDEIWTPRSQEHDPQLEKVKALMKRNQAEQEQAQAGQDDQGLSATKFATKLARKKRKNPRVKVRALLNNRIIDGTINIFILWALFSEDIRVLALPKQADYPIWYTHIFVMATFCLELVARCYSQRGFANSFYFWLDVIASGSMAIDFLPIFSKTDSSVAGQSAIRAAKSARVGTRLARLVRVLRIIRVIKLFISAKRKKKGAEEEEEKVEDEGAPSELSKALQGTLAKRTIVFVLVLLAGQVLLEFPPYTQVKEPPVDDRIKVGLAQLNQAVRNSPTQNITEEPWVSMSQKFREIVQSPLILSSVWTSVNMALFRIDLHNFGPDGVTYTFWPPPGCADFNCDVSLFNGNDLSAINPTDRMVNWAPKWPMPDDHWPECDYKYMDQQEVQNVIKCPNLFGRRRTMRQLRARGPSEINIEAYVSSSSSNQTGPIIEAWYSRKYAEDVQAGFNIMLIMCIAILLAYMGFLLSKDVDALVVRPIESMVESVSRLAADPAYKIPEVEKVRYETDKLMVSLAKIATMLQVGFGEAGNNLVAENLKKGDTVDPMVPGRKLMGAYGFCIIDDYEEVLECLGEEILPFTNTAATIVHDAVTENRGQPNRNLGEAFLCVWKPHYPKNEHGEMQTEVSPAELSYAETNMCDGALTAFRRCVRGIAMSNTLQAYNKHEEIVKYFDGNYTTRIGYGLHYGWAIEGAVGTNIKIDCSYLSPNVNLAARLESATKMYGVNILMSESFHSRLSPAVQQGLRRVDVVCLKGSSIPMAIYTCDRSNALYVAPEAIAKYGEGKVIEEFQRVFEEGMDAFVSGDWTASKGFFEAALNICPRDKPSTRILMHMDTPESHPDMGLATTSFVAPDGWPGYHILLSK